MKLSILNLLLVLTAVAAMLGIYSSRQTHLETVQRYELRVSELNAKQVELEGQNRALRQELGCLTITAPEQIHAVKLRTNTPRTWSYRVHLPEGANYYFACQINSLPMEPNPPTVRNPPNPSTIGTIATNSIGIGRASGEYVVTLSIHQTNSSEWNYKLNVRKTGEAGDGATGGSIINGVDGKWPTTEDWSGTGGVSNQTELPVGQSSLVLLDFRAMNENQKSSKDSDQGAMLWVGIAR